MKVYSDGMYHEFTSVEQALQAHRQYNYAKKNPGLKVEQMNDQDVRAKDLSRYDLSGLTANRCDFRGCKFSYGNLTETWFAQCNFEGGVFNETVLNFALFDKCILDGNAIPGLPSNLIVDASTYCLESTQFLECSMVRVRFRGHTYKDCDFCESDLTDAEFFHGRDPIHILQSSFNRTNLFQTRFNKSKIVGCGFYSANLQGTDFSNTVFEKCKFTGAVYDRYTKWPEGFDTTDKDLILMKNL